jgi:Flp pilus assembly protein TadB
VNSGRSQSIPKQGAQRRPEPPVVHSITGAAQAHSQDLDARIKRYLFSMALRTVCVILVLVVHSPIRWVFAVLAVVLPYVAVVMANAAGGRRRR